MRKGYKEGYLRKSVVDPLTRKNTGDNTPAIIYTELVPGDKLKISFMPKGAGSENMSVIRMLRPTEGVEGIKNFVLECVQKAGANPCPPVVIGVGIGGDFEKAALIAKKSLLRPIGSPNAEARTGVPRRDAAQGREQDRHRPRRAGRQGDGHGSACGKLSLPYREPAGGGEHQLPCGEA